MNNIKYAIAKKCADGPQWIRSFQDMKPTLDRMIAAGDLVLVAPPNGRGRNMVGLSEKGVRHYGLTVDVDNIFAPPEPSTGPSKQELRAAAQAEVREKRLRELEARKQAEADRLKAQTDSIAEHFANGGSINGACEALGIGRSTVTRCWRQIKDDLGWQAQ